MHQYDWFANEILDDDKKSFSDNYAMIRLLAKDFFSGNDDARKEHCKLIHVKFKVKQDETRIEPVYSYSKDVIGTGLDIIDKIGIKLIPDISLALLPLYSFFLQFPFTLATPYLSKDDETFHVCENPVRKDKVFKVPMVEGSSWKGNLRWTATKLFADRLGGMTKIEAIEGRCQIIRLFGAEKEGIKKAGENSYEAYLDGLFIENFKEKKVEGKKVIKGFRKKVREKNLVNKDGMGKGRLHFYPTFFNTIGLEVINPHDRKTKAGTIPVNIECVPEGGSGVFSLLYLAGFSSTSKEESASDVTFIANVLKEMMLTYGFSAKKSSGYGIVKKELPEDRTNKDDTSKKGRLRFQKVNGVKNEADHDFASLDELVEMLKPPVSVKLTDELIINSFKDKFRISMRRK